MTSSTATVINPATARKPRDEEVDVYGLTHPGLVRKDNQDHFAICALQKQVVVVNTSLPDPGVLQEGSERLAFLAMHRAWSASRASQSAASHASGSASSALPR